MSNLLNFILAHSAEILVFALVGLPLIISFCGLIIICLIRLWRSLTDD